MCVCCLCDFIWLCGCMLNGICVSKLKLLPCSFSCSFSSIACFFFSSIPHSYPAFREYINFPFFLVFLFVTIDNCSSFCFHFLLQLLACALAMSVEAYSHTLCTLYRNVMKKKKQRRQNEKIIWFSFVYVCVCESEWVCLYLACAVCLPVPLFAWFCIRWTYTILA